jgi:8-oxo-dGTP pyrophosphatase MutT (NUDIX family)
MPPKLLSNLDLVRACDNCPYDDFPEPLYTLHLPQDSRPHGYLLESNIRKLPPSKDFHVNHTARTLTLDPVDTSTPLSESCTAAFQRVVDTAIENDIFVKIHGQHSEPFPILGARYRVQIERFAADLYGITARGAHLTVYTMTEDGMRIWVPRRSPDMFTYPNKLDSTVAGGVAAGETPMENLLREAQEEASLPSDMVRKGVKGAGVLTYMSYEPEGVDGREAAIVPDVVFCYDLEVDADVKPVPEDGEVKEFYLMSVEEVQGALGRGEFKTNSAVVMLDFLVRHSYITAENEEDYVEILQRMHRRLPFPVRP